MTVPEPPSSDLELVLAYRGGDEQAARRLVERHVGAVARFLHAGGVDPGELEDLVQETLFRAFRRIGSWGGERPFRSWLVAIAANLWRDERGRRKGRILLPLVESDHPVAPAADAPAEERETEERLRQGIARLPRLQREVFLRRIQLGEGYDEIATALGTTSGAARVHYHHAVKRLKELVR